MRTQTEHPIRAARTQQGLKLEELARMSGVHISNLSRIENGKQSPRVETLRAVARALGVDAWWTLVEEDDA